MTTTTQFDEDGVKLLLIGDEKEVRAGIGKLDNEKREHILRIIKRIDPTAQPDDLLDIYQDVMLKVFRQARGDTPRKRSETPLWRQRLRYRTGGQNGGRA